MDITIEPGWSIVSIDEINQLKELVHDATDEYLTKVACQKMEMNLKMYRSLNTRPSPVRVLRMQLNRCMVAYS